MAVATDLLPAHVAVAYARGQSPACGAVLQQLRLPALSELIQKLPHQEWLQGDGLHPQMPHERLAIDLATRAAAAPGESNAASSPADHGARITPTHWSAHANHIDLTDPAGLQLTAQESQALCAAMAPYFVEDGLQLAYQEPLVWHAQSSLFAGLALPSLDRALGRSLLDWIPRAPQAAPLRRLQQEMQMLLHTHPVNESRLSRGLLPVNSFWISRHLPSVAGLHLDERLRRSAIAEDWHTWLQTWEQIDADLCAPLLARAQAGHTVSLSLCGELQAVTLSGPPAPPSRASSLPASSSRKGWWRSILPKSWPFGAGRAPAADAAAPLHLLLQQL